MISTGEIVTMSDEAVVHYLKSLERERASLDARSAVAMARLAVLRPYTQEYVADELAAELRWTPTSAANRLGDAIELVESLPATLRALDAGRIDWIRARTILNHTKVLDPALRRQVEAEILPYAATRTVKLTREKLAREVAKADPDGAVERHQRRVPDSTVDFSPDEDGMATLYVYGPAETVRPIFDVLDQCARGARRPARKHVSECCDSTP